MNVIERVHGSFVYGRRVSVLARMLAPLLPPSARVLDVGCGDGLIDSLIMQFRPDVAISGIDVLVRGHTHISVTAFNGHSIPYEAGSFDAVVFVDVLHHTKSPENLLQEAKRVSSNTIIIKDHAKNGRLGGAILRLMDWVGNAHHGVALPYNYWTRQQWRESFDALDLTVEELNAKLGLYPWPATWIFDRSLHFIAKLRR